MHRVNGKPKTRFQDVFLAEFKRNTVGLCRNKRCWLKFSKEAVQRFFLDSLLDWATAHQGHPLADVARTTLLIKIGQVPYGGRLMKTIIDLWRGLFLRTYLTRYFELQSQMTRKDLTPWLIPVAVGRLEEGIAGEEAALQGEIECSLTALGMPPTRLIRLQLNLVVFRRYRGMIVRVFFSSIMKFVRIEPVAVAPERRQAQAHPEGRNTRCAPYRNPFRLW